MRTGNRIADIARGPRRERPGAATPPVTARTAKPLRSWQSGHPRPLASPRCYLPEVPARNRDRNVLELFAKIAQLSPSITIDGPIEARVGRPPARRLERSPSITIDGPIEAERVRGL